MRLSNLALYHPESWRFWREWTAGLSLVRRGRTVSALFLIMAVQAVAQGIFMVLFIVFVERALHNGAAAIGTTCSTVNFW